MIPVDSLLYKIDQKLNKLSTNEHQQIQLEDKILALNEAQIKLIKQKVDGFSVVNRLGIDSFKKTACNIMRDLIGSRKIPGEERIYTAGEKEYIAEQERSKKVIALNKSLQNDIKTMKEEIGLDQYKFPF